MSDSRGDEVTLRLLPGGEDDGPLLTRRRPAKFCAHQRFELDARSRRVYCRNCGDEVDAYDAMVTFAGQIDRLQERHRLATAEVKQVEAKLQELKRLERNAKARVKRAGER